MIDGYAQLGEDEEALRLFKKARLKKLDVNDFTFSSVIQVCGNSTFLELGKTIQGLCLKTSYDSSSFVGSALISLYSKCGAYMVFEDITVRNLGMWNLILIAYAQHAHTKEVFSLFKELCRILEEGKYYFELMKEYGIEPEPQHYASNVDLRRAGKLQDAASLIKEMPTYGICLDCFVNWV
ncbi:Pentatricopeptide repeat [Dillenia turbinata]|uniref:Pentatricopeptide repeat n=1 Tax=Dillenia turbinata TaxID=194707 RepID=A0AAN8ZL54_9MAGN